jgi:uroporphyrinogen decarboxylase
VNFCLNGHGPIMTDIKNDLFLKALRGESVSRPPVWIMRQAGRYLPDYRKLRDKHGFFERCFTPALCAEITVMPVDQVGTDAAILFSDILVVPMAMGMEVTIEDGKGPRLPGPIRSKADVDKLTLEQIQEKLRPVFDGIRETKSALQNRVPLIGFSGAPWTLLCYMVDGKGSKDFSVTKSFCYREPVLAMEVLNKITDAVIIYLKEKVKAGVDAVQLFDSWAGILSHEQYFSWSFPFIKKITEAISPLAPVIVYTRGANFALKELDTTAASAIGIDWTIHPSAARSLVTRASLQGNMDPTILYAPHAVIRSKANEMLTAFGPNKYIANLGHGILPDIAVDNVKVFIDAVKSYEG